MFKLFRNKCILVTGGAGSIGRRIIQHLLPLQPKHIRSFDNNESAQFQLTKELQGHANLRYLIGDVRDADRVRRAMEGVDYVFHCSALKHVPLCEYNPFEAVSTNVLGTQNVLDAAIRQGVHKVINISTDKAVNPYASMGATKLLAERLTSASYYFSGGHRTQCATVRFGNVMNTNGSVIPTFLEQIAKGEPVTVTDDRMTRFMMSTDQAIDLIFEATTLCHGGEIFILKMPVLKMSDLAHVLIQLESERLDQKPVGIRFIGIRPGEKIHEELMTSEEAQGALELPHMFILPPGKLIGLPSKSAPDYPKSRSCQHTSYCSKDVQPLSQPQVRKLLMDTVFSTKTSTTTRGMIASASKRLSAKELVLSRRQA